ncbi:MAG: hypothetical protein HYS98_08080, partial [Deltaproteobacteria bacterium]|nr:hypothetical protein [Deltaproteobacteria bacterium]
MPEFTPADFASTFEGGRTTNFLGESAFPPSLPRQGSIQLLEEPIVKPQTSSSLRGTQEDTSLSLRGAQQGDVPILNINIDPEFTLSNSEWPLAQDDKSNAQQDDKPKPHNVSIIEYDDETGELIGVYQTQENSTLHLLAKANPKKFKILSELLKTDSSSSHFHDPLAIQNSDSPSDTGFGNSAGPGDNGIEDKKNTIRGARDNKNWLFFRILFNAPSPIDKFLVLAVAREGGTLIQDLIDRMQSEWRVSDYGIIFLCQLINLELAFRNQGFNEAQWTRAATVLGPFNTERLDNNRLLGLINIAIEEIGVDARVPLLLRKHGFGPALTSAEEMLLNQISELPPILLEEADRSTGKPQTPQSPDVNFSNPQVLTSLGSETDTDIPVVDDDTPTEEEDETIRQLLKTKAPLELAPLLHLEITHPYHKAAILMHIFSNMQFEDALHLIIQTIKRNQDYRYLQALYCAVGNAAASEYQRIRRTPVLTDRTLYIKLKQLLEFKYASKDEAINIDIQACVKALAVLLLGFYEEIENEVMKKLEEMFNDPFENFLVQRELVTTLWRHIHKHEGAVERYVSSLIFRIQPQTDISVRTVSMFYLSKRALEDPSIITPAVRMAVAQAAAALGVELPRIRAQGILALHDVHEIDELNQFFQRFF